MGINLSLILMNIAKLQYNVINLSICLAFGLMVSNMLNISKMTIWQMAVWYKLHTEKWNENEMICLYKYETPITRFNIQPATGISFKLMTVQVLSVWGFVLWGFVLDSSATVVHSKHNALYLRLEKKSFI